MICYSLARIFPIRALEHGSRMEEIYVNPRCKISDWRLLAMHRGKDASLYHMLRGGNGFPACPIADPDIETMFDLACNQEQRDLTTVVRSY